MSASEAIGEEEGPPDRLPDEIDADFAPRHRPSVLSRRFGDDVLLVDGENGRIHLLNSTAGLLWECFDGGTSLEELSADVAASFGLPLPQAREDVLRIARQVGFLGLLEHVSLPTSQQRPSAETLDVGEHVEAFAGSSSSGELLELPRPGATGTLLVNWSPSCGYCEMIAGELAGYRPGLSERGVDLVLLTVGSPQDNEPLARPLGLEDALIYRFPPGEGGAPTGNGSSARSRDPFGSMGTPVAYLIDGDGRVARPLALGSGNVRSLARELSGASPDAEETPGGAEQPRALKRRSLPAASGMCGTPSNVTAGTSTLSWASTSAYQVGGYQVGIRADSPATEELLGRALAPYRIAEAAGVADNFSVALPEQTDSGATPLNLLLAGDQTVVRSRSRRRVLAALAAHLSDVLRDAEDGLLRASSVAALSGDAALLLPPATLYCLDRLQPRLARLGVRLSDEPVALVDAAARELVVPKPTVAVAPEVMVEAGGTLPTRTELPAIEPGRYPLLVWSFAEDPSQRSAMPSRATAVAGALAAVNGEPEELPAIIDALEQVFEDVRAAPLRSSSPSELTKSIEVLVEHVGS